MKQLPIFLALLLPVGLFGQRGEVPEKNPDNALDLKVVFQEYSQTTYSRYGGHQTITSEYLNLKVNDLYLPNDRGISTMHFDRYLSNCPKAHDLSLEGLTMYEKQNKNKLIGTFSMLGGFAVGAYFGYQNFRDGGEGNRGIYNGLIAAGTGMAINYAFGKRGDMFKNKGDQMIIHAFDMYANDCFREDLYTPTEEVITNENNAAANGESNENEQILIDLISNNANSKFLTISALGVINFMEATSLSIGPELGYYKKGFYFNANAQLIRTFAEARSSDLEYGVSANISIPFFKGITQKEKYYLDLGKLRRTGQLTKGTTVNTDDYRAYAIDLGINYSQENVMQFEPRFRDYFLKSTMLRGGLSRSFFSEHTFTINDNRFTEGVRYSALMAKFYINAVYNLNRDYRFLSSGVIPTVENNLGFIGGLDFKYSSGRKSRVMSVVIEGGKYPIVNAISNWGVQAKVGYGIYFVDRKKSKSRSRRTRR